MHQTTADLRKMLLKKIDDVAISFKSEVDTTH
jgi:hypothetical protein